HAAWVRRSESRYLGRSSGLRAERNGTGVGGQLAGQAPAAIGGFQLQQPAPGRSGSKIGAIDAGTGRQSDFTVSAAVGRVHQAQLQVRRVVGQAVQSDDQAPVRPQKVNIGG